MAVQERLLASVVATDRSVYLGGGSSFAGTVVFFTGGGTLYSLVMDEESDLQ